MEEGNDGERLARRVDLVKSNEWRPRNHRFIDVSPRAVDPNSWMGSKGFEKKPVHALEGSLCHQPAECLDAARKMAFKLSLIPFSPDYA
jgi:hypothetical protein